MTKRLKDPTSDVVEGIAAVDKPHYDSNTLIFRRAIGEILGSGQFIYLARRDTVRLTRLATGPMKMRPLRWSALSPEQMRKMEEVIPFRGPDDLVSYGDTVVMVCPAGRYEEIVRARMVAAQSAREGKLTAEQLSRETGMNIEDRWEDLPSAAVPRTIF